MVRVGGPAEVASPAGEGVAGIGCSFYAHHVAVVVGASRVYRDRAARRRSDRQGDDIQIEGSTDGLVAVDGDRGGVGGPAQVASPAGEGITGVGRSFMLTTSP